MYKSHLLNDGVPPQNKGFLYLNDAIRLYDADKKIMTLYADIASIHNTTPVRVERAMRHAIQKSTNPAANAKYIASRKLVLWADVDK